MYLKTALANIRRAPFQATAAILVLAVTFFVATIIAILIYSSNQVLSYFETRPQVIAFLKSDAKENEIVILRNKLTSDTRVKDIKFVSKEEALVIYKNATSDNPLLGELVSPSVFPASVEFSVKDLSKTSLIIDEVKKEPIVTDVGFTASVGNQANLKDVIDRLTRITTYIRIGGLGIAAVLALTSFLVLMVVISMRIATRRSEIETLKLMGATSGFIQTPIMFEAVIYVIVGVLIGWIFALILILYVAPTIISYFGLVPVLPKDSLQFFELNFIILGIELLIGFLIASLGGFTAVSRAINK